MRLLVILALCSFVGLAASATCENTRRENQPEITVVRSENAEDGSFHYETSDGTQVQQRGFIKNPEALPEKQIRAVEGAYSYTSEDGEPFSLTYTADETGYHPISDMLPTPPPIPLAIQRSLHILYANAEKQIAAAKAKQARANKLKNL